MPCQFNIYIVYFLVYGLVWSNIRNSLDAEKEKKLIKKYRFYRAEEDNQLNLLKLFKSFSFFTSLKFRCCSFCFIKKNYS